jgi:hypothetical protein
MGRQTIREVLEESIELLKSNNRIDRIRGAKTIHVELSLITGFDSQILSIIRGYSEWMVLRYQTVFVVGIQKRLMDLWKAKQMKSLMIKIINMCEKKDYGDGEQYMKEILKLIRKELQ